VICEHVFPDLFGIPPPFFDFLLGVGFLCLELPPDIQAIWCFPISVPFQSSLICMKVAAHLVYYGLSLKSYSFLIPSCGRYNKPTPLDDSAAPRRLSPFDLLNGIYC